MASFKKLKSGWQYCISYKDGDKYRTKSGNGFRTKKEAEIAARKVEEMINNGAMINQDITFVDYMEKWYQAYKKKYISAKSQKNIEYVIETAKKYFKDMKIKDLRRIDYQSFLNWYQKDHAPSSTHLIHTYCKACLHDALNDHLIDSNPTYRVTPTKRTKLKKKVISI